MKGRIIENQEALSQFKNLILMLLIIIDLIFIVAITIFDLPYNDIAFMAYFDLFVCLILAINLIYSYFTSQDSLKTFLKEHMMDIIAIIPFNFLFLRYLMLFRVFRIIQFFQVIRIVNMKKVNVHSFKYFVHNQLLQVLIIILVIYMVISSIILYTIDDNFFSVFDTFWYNIVTITGVGYGDFTPESSAGKVIGMLTIIIGVLFISVFTAAMSALYMEKPETETRQAIENHLNKMKEENKKLKLEINKIEKETEELNEKIDMLIEKIDS